MGFFDKLKDVFVNPVGSLINVGSNLLGSWLQRDAQKDANDANLKLAREQMAFSKEQTALQNEYNSPANQIARYRDAGLNPNLMYGSVTSGNQSNIPTYTPANIQPVDAFGRGVGRLGMDMLQAMHMTETIKNQRADGEIKLAQAENIREQTNYTRWQSLVASLGYEKAKAYAPYFLANAELEHFQLNNQYKQGLKQLDIMDETIQTSELNRYLSQLRYELDSKKFDHQQKMDILNHITSVEQFKQNIEMQKDHFNRSHTLASEKFAWDKGQRYTDIGVAVGSGLINGALSLLPVGRGTKFIGKVLKGFKKLWK